MARTVGKQAARLDLRGEGTGVHGGVADPPVVHREERLVGDGDTPAAGGGPGEFDGGGRDVGAVLGELHPLRTRHVRQEPFGGLGLQQGGAREADAIALRSADRLVDPWMPVAEGDSAQPDAVLDVGVVVDVPHLRPAAPHDHHRRGLRVLVRAARVGVGPAGDDLVEPRLGGDRAGPGVDAAARTGDPAGTRRDEPSPQLRIGGQDLVLQVGQQQQDLLRACLDELFRADDRHPAARHAAALLVGRRVADREDRAGHLPHHRQLRDGLGRRTVREQAGAGGLAVGQVVTQLAQRLRHRVGEAGETPRGGETLPGLVVVRGPEAGVGLPAAGREHDGDPAVEVVSQGGDRGETCELQRTTQRREGEVGVVAVAQRGPLTLLDDVAERLDEEHGQPAVGERRSAALQGGPEVAVVHEAEAVDQQVRGPADRLQVEEGQPAAAVRGAELDDRPPPVEVA